MTDRASAEGHRYDHDGMHRHHHEYGPTGRAIWWEYADQFGGDFTEHTHADRADLVDALDAAREALRDQFSADHGDDWSVADAARYAEDKATLDKRLAVLAAIVATPDRASAEGLHTLAPHDGCRSEDCEVEALVRRLALRDTGPRPDSGIDGLAGHIRESLDANNAFEYDDPINGVMTGFDGNKDVLAEAIAADLARLSTPDLPAGWLHGPTGDDGKPIVLATPRTKTNDSTCHCSCDADHNESDHRP